MKAVRLLSILFLGIFLTSTAHAKDLKIAYVELGSVFNSYQKTKDFDGVLQKESQVAKEKVEGMIKKINDDQGKLALLKEDERQRLQADIEKQVAALKEFESQKRAELAKKFEDMRKQIILEIEKVVSDAAKTDGYTFVLSDASILYGEKEANITEKVLKTLNDNYAGKK